MKTVKFLFFLVILVIAGCTSNNNHVYIPYSGGAVPMIAVDSSSPKALEWKDAEEVRFEDIIEDIRYIPLGDEEDVMGHQIKQVLYHNGTFYLYDFQQDEIFLYNEEGKCLKKISDRGKGPKEYIAIGNIDINPEGSALYLLDRITSVVSVYNLTGDFQYKLKTPIQNAVVFSMKDSTRFVQMQPFQNKGSEEIEGYGYLVMKGDSLYRNGFKYLPSQTGVCGSYDVIDSYDNQSLYFKPLFSDSIYHVMSDSACSLAYYLKDEESVWKKHWKSESFVNMMMEKGTAIWDFFDMKDEFLFRVHDSKENKLNVLLYDKHNGKSYRMNFDRAENVSKIHHMWGLDPTGTYKGEYITCVLPVDYIQEYMRARVENGELEITNPELKKIVMNIDSDCNPVLVLVKFKLPGQ